MSWRVHGKRKLRRLYTFRVDPTLSPLPSSTASTPQPPNKQESSRQTPGFEGGIQRSEAQLNPLLTFTPPCNI